MTPRGTPTQAFPRTGLRWVAVICAAMVWALGVLAASPDLHELIHADANHAGHTCAITLFSQGLENPSVGASLAIAPSLMVVAFVLPIEPQHVESVTDWLLPGRGPPVS